MYRLIYISRYRPRTLQSSASDCAVAIARQARNRNRELDLTGALIGTENHFAQILEGEEVAIRNMMRRIGTDRRHDLVRVVSEGSVGQRIFSDWSMACIPGTTSLDQSIGAALPDFGQDAARDSLVAGLILQYSKSRRSLSRLRAVREQGQAHVSRPASGFELAPRTAY